MPQCSGTLISNRWPLGIHQFVHKRNSKISSVKNQKHFRCLVVVNNWYNEGKRRDKDMSQSIKNKISWANLPSSTPKSGLFYLHLQEDWCQLINKHCLLQSIDQISLKVHSTEECSISSITKGSKGQWLWSLNHSRGLNSAKRLRWRTAGNDSSKEYWKGSQTQGICSA